MAMRTASPWWVSLVFGLGLFMLLVGERLLATVGGINVLLTGAGALLVLAVTALRAWTMSRTTGPRRRVERTLFACHAATLVALVLYALTTSWGPSSLHTPHASGALTVLWGVIMLASLVPVLMIELSLGTALRTGFELEGDEAAPASVEHLRVRDVGWSGLTVAFAISLAMMTCQVARERNVQRDVSYFKTSAPGESTRNIVKSSSEPIRVYLFFPDVNEVKEQVMGYFEQLQDATGKLQIELHDRLVDAELAGKYKVPQPPPGQKEDKGVIVLARGAGDKEKSFNIDVDLDLDKARRASGKLRVLDREVNSNLMKVMREKRKVYLITGHGEMNDSDSMPPDVKSRLPDRRITEFKRVLGRLNYEPKDLGFVDLVKDVPEDAQVVVLLAPTVPLDPVEWAALERYLDRGGRLLVSLDPKAQPTLGSLEARLGVKLNPAPLTDDVAHYPGRRTAADNRIPYTTQFTSHASTTAIARVNEPLFLFEAGSLEEVPVTRGDGKKTVVVRSMESSWLDTTDNMAFDGGSEKKQKWNIAVAVEGPKLADKEGFRAMVFSDVDLWADIVGINSLTGQPALRMVAGLLLQDVIRWLGGEEVFSGEVVSEEDKPIEHTKNQDKAWFTITIVGAPLLVLTLGLVATTRRRRQRKTKEVTP